MAGPFEAGDFDSLVPADKKLHPDWVRSLFERGTRTVYRGAELEKIGMPIGGLCSGQLYLGGDGRLWHWGIFNQIESTNDAHYAHPPRPDLPLSQGFALRLTAAGKSQTRTLDRAGWKDISFIGEYPMGFVEYSDPEAPATISLEAFSPFIPLNTEDSALPATVMRFTVKNTGLTPLVAELAGWLENAVCLHSAASLSGEWRNRIVRGTGFTFLECSVRAPTQAPRAAKRPDILFDDFENETYEGWTVTGTAFGSGPIEKDKMPAYQGDVGAHGRRLVNSHNARQGENVTQADAHTGAMLSRTFVLERDYITFLIGGGAHRGRTCLNLLVDGRVVLSATGHNDNRMQPHSFDVRRWAGQSAQLQIVDNEKGAWGNIGIDEIVLSDEPHGPSLVLSEQPDFGTMGLVLLAADKPASSTASSEWAHATLPSTDLPAAIFEMPTPATDASASRPFGQKLVGALGRKLVLEPGRSATVTFAVCWHFPNLKLSGLEPYNGRWYGKRFAHASAVAEYLAGNFKRLQEHSRLWHETWYDSTLPYWLLDRTFLNTSILATNTCYWFGNGRFYAWEGVGCCAGTCAHVWHYAHAMSRLFPPLERSLRQRVDFGLAFDSDTGRIRFRAEHNNHWAVDAQAGCILRAYREHQMSPDAQFLRPLWPRVKKALQFLIAKDLNQDGLIDGPQHNTLDADWYGQIAWLSGLYLAALRAGQEMATELGDGEFAQQCAEIFRRGVRHFDATLFNGEYYIQLPDPAHPRTVGSYNGCEIDQVFGQSWAWQVGLGRILDEAQTKTALRSLWQYNFTPDVGPYRKVYRPGRWYAMAGEGGLLMCAWPKGEAQRVKESFDFYFNECMTGFEYQAAWHFIAEGMLLEGLAITRTIHDRYHPLRRNPWNEVECGDHYARAMASYGVFLAACGYEYHGPKGHLGFSPRFRPENFKAAFTTAEGWGSYAQQMEGGQLKAQISVTWGKLRLRSLTLGLVPHVSPVQVALTLGDQSVAAQLSVAGGKAQINLEQDLVIDAGQVLRVSVA